MSERLPHEDDEDDEGRDVTEFDEDDTCPMPCASAPLCPCFDFQLPDTPEGWAGDWDAVQR